MSDARLRAIERKWQETGAPNDLETLMNERARTGDTDGAAADGRRLLEGNIDHANARATVARYAPLLWTGTVSVGSLNGEDGKIIVREGLHTYEANVSPYTAFARIRDFAYAGDTLTILTEKYEENVEAFVFQRIDIPANGTPTHQYLDRRPIQLHANHTRGVVETINQGPETIPLHTSPSRRILARQVAPHAIETQTPPRDIPTPDLTDAGGSAGMSPWMHEDGKIYFSDFRTILFREGPRHPADVDSISYGSTRTPTRSRLALGNNRTEQADHLASVYDGIQRSVVEVPITILNALRELR